MGFMNAIKKFWKKQSNQSQQFIKEMPILREKARLPLSIEYKIHLTAKELTSNQDTINTITSKIIENDPNKRKYAGKSAQEFKKSANKIFKYESYRTQNVKIVPSNADRLDIYIDDIFLGKLPNEYTKNTLSYLQSTIVANFAYIKGGPYKYYNGETEQIIKDYEPFDLTIYIQFS